jgi:hypothetical protein
MPLRAMMELLFKGYIPHASDSRNPMVCPLKDADLLGLFPDPSCPGGMPILAAAACTT